MDPLEIPYCDYCELEGHTFRSCPRRDDATDEPDDELEGPPGGRLARDELGRRPVVPNDPIAPWRDPY